MPQHQQRNDGQHRDRNSARGGRDRQDHQEHQGQHQDQGNGARRGASANLNLSMPMIALRGMGQLFDMQMQAARIMMQTQARAATAFGWPDYSGLFSVADERAKRVFSAGAEQMLQFAEKAGQTTSEVQRQFGRVFEIHAVQAADSWQQGLEEIGAQTEESLEELKQMARQQADEAIRTAESAGEQVRLTLRMGGEEFRRNLRDVSEEMRHEAGEAAGELRHEGEQAAGNARDQAQSATEKAANARRRAA